MHNETDVLLKRDECLEFNTETPTPFTIRVFTDYSALAYLYEDWKELAEKSAQALCMSPDWSGSWWKHYGQCKNRSLYIITAYHDEKLVAIFPFYKGITSIGGYVIEQRLQLIGSGGNRNEQLGFADDYGISDFLDFIVDPDYYVPVTDLFLTLINSSELSETRIILHQIRDDSYIKKFIYQSLLKNNKLVTLDKIDSCPFVDLSQTKNLLSFVEQCKSNARRRFRQAFRAEGPGKEYQIEEAKTLQEVEEMTNQLMKLHQKRWNDIGFPGAFHDQRFIAFFKEIVHQAYLKNQLWLKQAVDSKGVCAVRMLLLYNGRYFDYMSGYDDNSPSAKYRPGIALLLNLIHDSFENNISKVELLRGEEGYKYDFTQKEITNWKITIPAQQQEKNRLIIPVSIMNYSSILYKYSQREVLLMKVQYRQRGLLKMFSGYLKFRLNSLKH